MAFSQNGRVVLERYGGPLVANVIPGTNGVKFLGGVLGGDIDVVLRYVAARWHKEVEPISDQAHGQWGYNYRAVRGQSSGFSNHASGSAVDINAAMHPLDTHTLSAAQRQALLRMQTELNGTVRFGAFYSGRVDEMHAEIVANDAALSRMASRIRAGGMPNVPAELRDAITENPPTPTDPTKPAPPTPEDDMYNNAARDELVGRVDRAQTVADATKAELDAVVPIVVETKALVDKLGILVDTGINDLSQGVLARLDKIEKALGSLGK